MKQIRRDDGRLYYQDEDGYEVAAIAGASADDIVVEDDDDEEEDEEPEDEKEDDEPKGGMDAEEAERVRKALKKANEEAKRFRLENKQLKSKTEDEQERMIREAREEESGKYKGIIAQLAFKNALAEAGLVSGHNRMAKMLDLEDVEIDEEGSVTGLDDQVKALKKDFPELFSKRKVVEGKGDVGNRDGGPEQKKTSAERIAEMANS